MRMFHIIFVFFFLCMTVSIAYATDFSSTDFKVSAPVLYSGEYSTSTDFQLFGSISQLAIGTSTVSGAYQVVSGFLYFPVVTAPVPSATAGNGQVTLTWSAATAAQGWSIGGYNVGRSTTSGGPYTYSASLGNVTSSIRTGLTNGTTYYFIVRAEDALGNSIATSSEVSAAPVASAAAAVTPAGGGAPGSVTIPGQHVGNADVFGFAYPRGALSFLIDGRVLATTVAGAVAEFSHTFSALNEGSYVLGVLGQDELGLRSPLVTFPLIIKRGQTTVVSGVLIPPTLTTDRVEVRTGDFITISGRSLPDADLLISIEKERKVYVLRTRTNNMGAYAVGYDTKELTNGRYTARSRVVAPGGQQSTFSLLLFFDVGEKIVDRELIDICEGAGVLIGDVNNDCRVNIVDFSIFAYWFDQQRTREIPLWIDLTGDGAIDLADFSVAAYYWTG